MQKPWAGLVILGAVLTMAAGPVAPAAEVMGDFDGNGAPDLARVLIGPSGFQLVVIPGGAGREITLASGPLQLAGDKLETKPPGVYATTQAGKGTRPVGQIETRQESISFTNEEGGERLFYWDGARYRSAWIAE